MTSFYVKKVTVMSTQHEEAWIISVIHQTGDFDKKGWACSGLMKKELSEAQGKLVINTSVHKSKKSMYEYHGYSLMYTTVVLTRP